MKLSPRIFFAALLIASGTTLFFFFPGPHGEEGLALIACLFLALVVLAAGGDE